MKYSFNEFDGCFSIEMQAENIQDAAFLTRFGINATEQINHISTTVMKDGEFNTSIVIRKHKKSNGEIPKRRG